MPQDRIVRDEEGTLLVRAGNGFRRGELVQMDKYVSGSPFCAADKLVWPRPVQQQRRAPSSLRLGALRRRWADADDNALRYAVC